MTCTDEPIKPSNRPGLPALSYRIGDYASFRDRLLSRLICPIITPEQPQGISLRRLNTRMEDDPAIALLDACAVVADVLTFYQERIINEGYLLTATERRSVLELARTIGYELNPGVAASAVLAFTVEDAPGSPTVATIPKGTQIQSLPEQDELPQTFETSEEFIARLEWNALKPRPSRPQVITQQTRTLYLEGTSTSLQPGDVLLLMESEDASKPHYLLRLDTVTPNPQAGYTAVTWNRKLPESADLTLAHPPRHPRAIAFRQRTNLFGFNAPRWESVPNEVKLTNGSPLKGGVYRYDESLNSRWQSVNTGLLSFDVYCITANPKTGSLLVGTPLGIFRSKTNGESWAIANAGLTNSNIQTIVATADGQLLAGTPNGGVFRSTDDGETWSPIGIGSITVTLKTVDRENGVQTSTPQNTGIPNTVVRSIAVYDFPNLTPATLFSDDRSVTVTPGTVPLTFQEGDVIVVGNRARVVVRVVSNPPTGEIVLAINDTFRDTPITPPPFPSVTPALLEELTNAGLTGLIVVGLEVGPAVGFPAGTPFVAFRAPSSPNNPPFLLTGSSGNFILAATDVGVYYSANQGKDWDQENELPDQVVRTLAVCPGSIFAQTNHGIYQSSSRGRNLNENRRWTLNNPTDVSRIRCLTAFGNDAFVGANNGVWRLRGSGSWTQINLGLEKVDVWAIAINATSSDTVHPPNGHLFAFTSGGIFKSITQGDIWEKVALSDTFKIPDLTTVNACVKSVVGSEDKIFVGSKFTGFGKASEDGWADFVIPTPQSGQNSQIDLDTVYPKILPDSWMILRYRNRYQLCKIKEVSEVQRQAFSLDAKITRVSTDLVIRKPEDFKLRETIVLAQSEILTLKQDPLTVETQQANIFFDPMWTNKILLSQYVAGLQSQHPIIISGKRIRTALLNVGGVVQTANAGDRWTRSSNNLTHTGVTSLASYRKPEAGILVRSLTAIRGYGTAFIKELKAGAMIQVGRDVQVVKQIYSDTSLEVKSTFAQLPETSFTYTTPGQGTIASFSNRVFGQGTTFGRELRPGMTLRAAGQQRTILVILSTFGSPNFPIFSEELADQFLFIDSPFDGGDLPPGTSFSYEGIGSGQVKGDRTTLVGNSDTRFTSELKPQSIITVNDKTRIVVAIESDNQLELDSGFEGELFRNSFSYSGVGTGTITSDNRTITGTNTLFTQELNTGVTISANGQFIPVEKILFDTSLTVSFPFNPALPPGTTFNYQGAGSGEIEGDRTAITGTNTQFTTALKLHQALTIDHQTRQITRIVSDNLLFVDADVDPNLSNQSFESLTLFVGTVGGGVFRSVNNGSTWESVNRGLTNLNAQAIALKTLNTEAEQTYQLFVSTPSGVYFSQPIAAVDGEIRWQQIIASLRYPDVRSLLMLNNGDLLAGTLNGGVLRSSAITDDSFTWTQTGLDAVDVQTLAIASNPSVNGDIFAGTIAHCVFRSTDGGTHWEPLEDGLTNPNVTSLLVYSLPGTGNLLLNGTTVIGVSATQTTAFTAEFAVGDAIAIAGQTKRVIEVLSDQSLKIDSAFDLPDNQPLSFEVTQVLAGTAGSGIFRLKSDPQTHQPRWEPLPVNPTDLTIRCLTRDPRSGILFVGTASSGMFRSADEGNLWTAINRGLTNLDTLINPAQKVNTEFRAIALLNQYLFAVGIGILISPDNLYTVTIRAGDRLQLMAPPAPLPDKGQEEALGQIEGQRWLLQNHDGFMGVVMTSQPGDIRLQPADEEDEQVSEMNAIALPPQDQQEPLLLLETPIQNSYDPQTVKIYANVVPTTQGETVAEVLGNGDGTIPHPQFILQKPPLTYISATTPSGSESTLQVRVNDVLWQEVPSLFGRSPLEPVYITRIADDGSVTITFGDGSSGARLPTGDENVTATYRSGIGLVGNVAAERLTLLNTRPLGISDVINPLPASGAENPERMAEAQVSAPLTVRTLGRIVSLQDYEDFARAFAGIGKAQAKLLWVGETQQVQVTVAAIAGGAVAEDSALYTNLVGAMDAARDPVQQVQVNSYEALAFNLEARLLIDSRYLPDKVLAQAQTALLNQFTFEKRDFGQAITAAEAIATLQSVSGVIAVDLDALHRRDLTRSLEPSLSALTARWDGGDRQILPAQLLVINPAGIHLQAEATP